MAQRSTLFLKIALILIGLPVLAACVFIIPALSQLISSDRIGFKLAQVLFLLGTYGSALAYYFALVKSWRLLSLIDRLQAFSQESVQALRSIKSAAVVISLIYFAELPILYLMAEADDAPGLILLGLIIAFASLVVAVFAAVLQRLLNDAMAIKSENDLTV